MLHKQKLKNITLSHLSLSLRPQSQKYKALLCDRDQTLTSLVPASALFKRAENKLSQYTTVPGKKYFVEEVLKLGLWRTCHKEWRHTQRQRDPQNPLHDIHALEENSVRYRGHICTRISAWRQPPSGLAHSLTPNGNKPQWCWSWLCRASGQIQTSLSNKQVGLVFSATVRCTFLFNDSLTHSTL